MTTQGNTRTQCSRLTARRSASAGWLARLLGVLAATFVVACATGDGDSARVLTPEEEAEFVHHIELARQLLDKGEAQESLPLLERSQELKPDAFVVHNNLCVAYGILQRRQDAVVACERAVEIDPTNQLAKNNLNWVSSIAPAGVQ